MFVLHARVRFAPNDISKLGELVGSLIETTRAEPGCCAYDMAVDVADNCVLHAYEVWDSPQAFASHLASDHFRSFASTMPKPIAVDRQVYEGLETEYVKLAGGLQHS